MSTPIISQPSLFLRLAVHPPHFRSLRFPRPDLANRNIRLFMCKLLLDHISKPHASHHSIEITTLQPRWFLKTIHHLVLGEFSPITPTFRTPLEILIPFCLGTLRGQFRIPQTTIVPFSSPPRPHRSQCIVRSTSRIDRIVIGARKTVWIHRPLSHIRPLPCVAKHG